MQEQLISFETAKLAKEKEFDLEVQAMTAGENYPVIFNPREESPYNWNSREGYSIPSQSLLQKWLREEQNIHIGIFYGDLSKKYMGDINSVNKRFFIDLECKYNTYEEALEFALQEALKLI